MIDFGASFKGDLRIHLGMYFGGHLGVIWGCVLGLILDHVFGGVWSRAFGRIWELIFGCIWDSFGVHLRFSRNPAGSPSAGSLARAIGLARAKAPVVKAIGGQILVYGFRPRFLDGIRTVILFPYMGLCCRLASCTESVQRRFEQRDL